MKTLIALCAFFAVSTANVIITADPNVRSLGNDACTWGPSYWCENIKSAAECKMTKHCITSSWEHLTVPEDNDSVCNICKDMVEQARSQLESNQTQEDLKAVFEGSCKLMRIKPIVKECVSIVDEYIPDLVETLASQMNPSVVCTVAGLCNSAHIDLLLEQHPLLVKIDEINSRSLERDELEPDECSKCYTVATHMQSKLNGASPDVLLQRMLKSCAYLGTYSDACSSIVLTHFDGIQGHLRENFKAQNICHLSGQCSNKFHVHKDLGAGMNVEIKPLSSVGVVDINDDLPCKLCEQLVSHLKDVLVANTTEVEFEQVLKGFCKQMKSFANECTSIVDEYYPQIYQYLTKGLNSNVVCEMAQLCPAPGKQLQDEEIWPLVSKDAAEIGMRIFQEAKKNMETEKPTELSKPEVEAMQLPIERLMPFPLSEGLQRVGGKESCALCENVLHYIQEAITNPATEDKVKQAVERVCKALPQAVQGECSEFVENYGDALVAILAQQIDPSQVCPMLRLCPSKRLMDLWKSVPEKYLLSKKQDKPTCSLCLLGIAQIYNVIKNNKTQANIQAALDKLCNRLPEHLKDQCVDFVQGYSKEIIELLLADLTPEEVCTYLKLCDATLNLRPPITHVNNEERQILTNEIPDSTETDAKYSFDLNPLCSICQSVMREVHKRVGGEKNKNKVSQALRDVCSYLPQHSKECKQLVNDNGDKLVDFIVNKGIPVAACTIIPVCTPFDNIGEILGGGDSEESRLSLNPLKSICKPIVEKIDELVGTDKNKAKVENEVHHVCSHLPWISGKCNQFISKHGNQIIDLILQDAVPDAVCAALRLRNLDVSVKADGKLVDINPICSVCQSLMIEVEKQLGSDRSKDKVNNVVHGICRSVPLLSSECSMLINQHSDQIVDFIVQKGAPSAACTVIPVCFPDDDAGQIIGGGITDGISGETRLGFNPLKSICKPIVEKISERVGSDKNKAKVENEVHHVCNHLPWISGKCNELITKHGDQIIDLILKDAVPTAVCTALRLRNLDDSADDSEESRLGFNPLKSVCKPIVEKISERVGTDKNKAKVENEVHRVCSHLPWISGKCNELISKHGNQIIDLILQDAVPDAVCAALRLRNLDDSADDYEDARLSLNPLKAICKPIVEKIDKLVGTDKNKAKVENAVHRVCNHLPRISRKCNELISKHGSQIIDLILKDAVPEAVCTALTLRKLDDCADNSADDSKESRLSLNPLKTICKHVVEKIDERVGSDKNKAKVENEVHRVCSHLPWISGKCNELISKHGDQIIDLILKDAVPDAVCAALRLRNLDDSADDSEDARLSLNPLKAICKPIVEKIDKLVGTDKNKAKVENAVHRVCNHLPRISRKCNELISKHGNQIIDLILKDAVPEVVCTALTLRKLDDSADNSADDSEESRLSLNPLKTICKHVVEKIDERVGSDKNKAKVENEVHRVCSHLPWISGKCNELISKHGDQIIDLILKDAVPDAVCAALRLRNLDDSADDSEDARLSLNPLKAICKPIVEKIDKLVGTDKNKAKVENAVHRVCNHLPRISRKCNELISKHGNQIIDLILKDAVPEVVCTALTLRKLDDSADNSADDSEESRLSLNPLKTICKHVVEKIDERVGSDKNKAKVENEVHRVCSHLPWISGKCNELISKHGDQIIDLILKDAVPDAVCAALRLRNLDDSADDSEDARLSLNPLKAICKPIVEKIDKLVGTDKNKAKVENAVHRVCNHLPRISRKCNELISKHGNQIIDLILKDAVPEVVCTALTLRKLDDSADNSADDSEESRLSLNPLKTICKHVVEKIDERVGSDKNKAKVENEVHRVCSHLPWISGKCNELISKHGDQIIDLILKDAVPDAVCAALRLRNLDDSADDSEDARLSLNPLKAICKPIVEKIDKLVGTDKNKAKVENAVHRVCNHLPRISRKCNELISKHGNQIIDLILKDAVPEVVCTALTLRKLDDSADNSADDSEESRLSLNPLKTICKHVVEKIDERVGSDKNKAKVENEVHRVCSHLPWISGKCNELISKHGDQIIDLILKDAVPDAVCAALRLRNLDDSADDSEDARLSLNPLKAICKPIVEKIDKLVGTDKNKAKVENAVHRVCNHLPRISRKCNELISKHGNQIIDLILKDAVPEVVCTALTLRKLDDSADNSADDSEESRLSLNPLKTICKHVVEKIDERVGSDKNKAKVENEVHRVCSHLPWISGKCNELISKHGDQIIDLILKDAVPDAVCAALRLRNLDDSADDSEDARLSLNPLKAICKPIVEKIDKLVGTDKNKAKVENAVHRVCNHLPRISRKCNELISKHGNQIIDLILKDAVPEVVCTALTLRKLDDSADNSADDSEESRLSLNPLKTICKHVVEKIDERVGSDKNKAKVENEVHRVCSHLPWISGKCNELISKHGDQIIDLILKDAVPDAVCAALRLRNLDDSADDSEDARLSLNPLKAICKPIVEKIDKLVGTDKNKAKVENAVHRVCNHLPRISRKCNELISKHGNQIIDLILKDAVPEVVCTALTLRKLDDSADNSADDSEESRLSLNPLKTICKHVVEKIDERVGSDKNKAKVENEVHRVCSHLPWISGKCNELISKHGDQIIDLILKDAVPDAVCAALRLRNLDVSVEDDAILYRFVDINPICSVCTSVMRQVEKQLGSDRTKDKVNNVVRGICSHVSVVSCDCTRLINKHSDQIVDFIINKGSPIAACTVIPVCFPDDDVAEIIGGGITNGIIGDRRSSLNPLKTICKHVVEKIDERVGTDKNKAKVENEVHRVCSHLPWISGKCNELISKHGDQIIDLILKDAVPDAVCAALRLRNLDDSADDSEDARLSLNPLKAICKPIVEKIDKLVGTDKNKAKVENAVHRVCNHLPRISRKCNELISKHGNQIIDLILKDAVPEVVCTALTLRKLDDCADNSADDSEESRLSLNPLKTICKHVVEKIDERVGTDKNKAKVENEVHRVCSHLPWISGKCNELISKHGDQIIDLILKDAVPDAVCAALRLRNLDVSVEDDAILYRFVDINPICSVCTSVMRQVEKQLGSDRTKDKVNNVVRGICSHVSVVSCDCTRLINKHSDQIVDFIINKGSPIAACTVIPVCFPDDDVAEIIGGGITNGIIGDRRSSLNPLKTICKHVVEKIDERVGTDKNKAKVENEVHRVCSHLPWISGKCNELISKHGDQIIDLILKDAVPDAVCAALRLRNLDDSADDSEDARLSLNPLKAICKPIVETIDKLVGTDKNKAKVENAVHRVCNHLPRISRKCNELISKHGNQIIDLILKDAVPEVVCTALTLRKLDDSADNSAEDYEESRLGLNPLKTICKHVVEKIDERVGSDKNKAKVENEVHRVCSHLPWISGKCNELISKHGDQIIDLILKDAVPTAVCAALRLRNLDVSVEDDAILYRIIDINPICSVCQSLMRLVEKQLGSDRSEDHVNNVVRGICRFAPLLSSKCSSLINQHSDQIINFIVNKGSPIAACTVVPVCSALDDAGQIIGGGISDGIIGEWRLSLNPLTTICKHVVEKIDERVGSDKNKAKVENEVHRVCSHLPWISGKCNELISKHGDQIIDLILKDAVPDAVCAALRLRNLDDSADDSEDARLSLNPLKAICKPIVEKIDKLVGTDKNKAKVENAVHRVCNHLPRISRKCNELISKHGNQIIDLILKDAVPEVVCTALTLRKLDDSADNSADDSEESRLGLNPLKTICKHVVEKIDERVGSDKNKAKVENEVHRVCSHLPWISGKCNELISKHGDQIIDLILKDAVPDAVCAALRLRNLDDSADDSEDARLSLNPLKAICKPIVEKIDKLVGTDKNKAKVENAVHRVCNHLPRISRKCNELISKHGNQIIDLILKDAVPEVVCTALTLRKLDDSADNSADDSEESRLSLNPLKTICKHVVEKIDERVGSDKNKAKVENEVHRVCSHLPWISGKCNELISKHGDQIIDLILKDAVPDAVCAALRLRNLDDSADDSEDARLSLNPLKAICKPIVEKIDKLVGTDKNKAKVENAVHRVCNHLPRISRKCNELISKHGNQIIDLILKDAVPEVVCTALTLRKLDDSADNSAEDYEESRLGLNPLKTICKHVVEKIDERVGSDKNKAKVENEVHRVCSHLPWISGKCNELISKHSDQIIDLILKDAVPDAVCAALRLRNLDDFAADSGESRISLNPLKTICKHVVEKIDEQVGTDKNKAKVENEVHRVCSHLPWISGKCNELISKHGDQIIDLILKDAVPDAVCAALRLRNLDDSADDSEDARLSLNPLKAICKPIVEKIDKLVGTDKNKAKVENAVHRVCNHLPRISRKCNELISKHGNQIIDLILKDAVPEVVCTALTLRKLDDSADNSAEDYEESRLGLNPLKTICKHVVEKIDERVGSDKNKAKVENEVHRVCSHLPWISGKCNELISKHGDQIIDLILKDAVPDAVCAALRLRNLDDSADDSEDARLSLNPLKAICKPIVEKIDKLVGTDKNKAKVENAVHRVCNHLPRISRKCNELISKHGNQIIDLILKDAVPEVVCTALTLRKLDDSADNSAEDYEESRLGLNPLKTICKHVVEKIDERVGSDKNKAKVENEVHRVCSHLPWISGKCNELISKHGDQIIDLILKDAVPDAVCAALRLRNLDDFAADSGESRISLNPLKTICKHVVEKIDEQVGTDKNKAKVENEVHRVCSHLPWISGKCNELISKHGDQIIDLILKDAVPDAVCAALRLRNLDDSADDSEDARLSLNPLKAICKPIVEKIDKLVGTDKNKAKVENAVHRVCNHLPRISRKCNELISKHGNQIIDLILKDAVPEVVCTALTLRKLDDSADNSAEDYEESRLGLNPLKTICKHVVEKIDERVGSDKNKAKVENEVHRVCSHLPWISGKCNELISKHGDQIIDLILKDAVPTAVCAALKLRNLEVSVEVVGKLYPFIDINPICSVCTSLMRLVEKHLGSDRSKDQVNRVVRGICRLTHVFSSQCSTLISQHTDKIVDFIVNKGIPIAACTVIPVCFPDDDVGEIIGGGITNGIMGQSRLSLNPLKTICKHVVEKIDERVGSDKNKAKVENEVHRVCSHLPWISGKCNELISKHGDQIIDLILKDAVPDAVCAALRLRDLGGSMETEGKLINLNPICSVCQSVMRRVAKDLGNDRSKNRVNSEVHRMCNYVPELSSDCKNLVNEYGDDIVDFIVKYGAPMAACIVIPVCLPTDDVGQIIGGGITDGIIGESRLSFNPLKTICKHVVEKIDERVGTDKNKAKVENEVHRVCSHLPWISGKCNELISKHGDQIIDLILKDAVPDAVCAALRLRNLDDSADDSEDARLSLNPLKAICKPIVETIDKLVGTDKNKAKVENAVHRVCNHLPRISRKCNELISKHGNQIIDLILKDAVPEVVCTALTLRKLDDSADNSAEDYEESRLGLNPLKTICKHVVEKIDERVGSDKNKAKVENEVHRVCSHLPWISGKCNELISKHGDQIIDLILKDAVPDAVCAALRLRNLDDFAADSGESRISLNPLKTICKHVVEKIDEQVGTDKNKAKVENEVHRVCSHLPWISGKCNELISKHGDQIIDLILKDAVPDAVCAALRLRNLDDFAADSGESRISLNPLKTICKHVVEKIDEQVGTDKNKAKVENEVHRVCSHLPWISGKCNELISKHGDQIIDLILKDAVPDAVCAALRLRNLDDSADDSEDARLSLNPLKTICKHVVEKIDERVGTDKNKAKVENEVHRVCSHLPWISGKCNELISKHGDQIIDLILKDAVPDAVCAALRLRNLDDFAADSGESRISLNPLKTICKHVVEKIDERVGTDKNKAKVENEVHRVCSHLPWISGKCNELISKHGDQIIDLILKDAVPDAVCAALRLRNLDDSADNSAEDYEESRLGLNPLKTICKHVVEKIDERVGSDKNKAKVENEVHRVCSHLPWISGKCNELISKHGDQIIDLILKDAVPDAVCAALRLRNLDDFAADSGESRISLNPLKTICKHVVEKIDERVGTDKNKAKVENEVHRVCSHLPWISGKCNELISKHGDQIIDLILKDAVPDAVCAALRLRNLDDFAADSGESRISLNPLKTICKHVVEKIDERVGTDKNKAKVENEVHRVCSHLPWISGKCNELISKHGDQIIDLILKDAVPDAVCAALRLRNLDDSADNSAEDYEESRLGLNPLKTICKHVVEKIDERVGSDKNKAKVENEVHRVCSHLPWISGKCNELISKHGDQIIDLILKDAVPDAVCAALRLRNLDDSADDSEDARLSLNPLKAICKPIVETIDKLVGTDKNKAKVENAVHRVCNQLPRISRKCNELISKHGNQIIDLILKDAVPEVVCTALTLRKLDDSADNSAEDYEKSRLGLNPLKTICKHVVEKIDERVGSDKNKAKVENEVHRVCSHLPWISGKCNELISKHGDQIIDLILKDAVPDAVCAALRLRNLDDSADDSEDARLSLNPLKAICKPIVETIDKLVGTDKNKAKVENAVHRVCNHLPRISRKCNELISKHGNQIIDLILKDAVPEVVCTALTLRKLDDSADNSAEDYEESRLGLNPLKTICKHVVEKIDERVGSDKNKAKVENEVHRVCSHLPWISGKCNELISKHGDQIIDLILKDAVPDAVCAALRLRNLDDFAADSGESRISLNPLKTICKHVVEKIDERVGTDKNKAKVENEVHRVCSHLPWISGKCNELISKHGDQIIDLILKDAVPDAVCAALRLRNLDDFTADSGESRISLNPLKTICKHVVEKIDERVGSDKNKAKVENEVHRVCSHLPWISGKCNELISKHGDQIIDLILKDAVPDAVCAALRLRNLDDFAADSGESRISLNPLKTICKHVVEKIDEQVGTDKNKAKVENEVHRVCSHLPWISGKCNELISKHGDQIIDLILKDAVPDAVCAALRLRSFDDDLIPPFLKASLTQCAVCKAFISGVDELLGNSSVDQSIKNVVSEACNYVPSKYQSQCVSIVQTHGQSVINLIERHTATKKICGQIGLCAARDLSMISLTA